MYLFLGCFLVWWIPFFTCNIMNAICIKYNLGWGPGETAFLITTFIGYINSCLNPVIYTIFNPEFRKAFKKIIGMGHWKTINVLMYVICCLCCVIKIINWKINVPHLFQSPVLYCNDCVGGCLWSFYNYTLNNFRRCYIYLIHFKLWYMLYGTIVRNICTVLILLLFFHLPT